MKYVIDCQQGPANAADRRSANGTETAPSGQMAILKVAGESQVGAAAVRDSDYCCEIPFAPPNSREWASRTLARNAMTQSEVPR